MTHADFSITYNFLNQLAVYDKQIGKMNSFFVVHIGGGLSTGVTTVIDTLIHLAACITKIATGIIATPIAYFTGSRIAKEWSWSAAGKHFLQAANHTIGLIAVPTTLLFGPKAALNLLFPQKIEFKKLQKKYSREVLLKDALENMRYNDVNEKNNLRTRLQQSERSQNNDANEKNNLRARLQQSERSHNNLENQIQQLKMQLRVSNANEEFSKSHEHNLSQAKKGNNNLDDYAIVELKNKLNEKHEEVYALSSRCKEFATKLDNSKNEFEEMKSTAINLERKLNNEVHDHQQCKNQFKILERKFNEIKNEHDATELNQQLQVKVLEISEMYERNREMSIVIENGAQEFEKISEQLNIQKIKNTKLTNKLNQSKNKIEENAQDIFNIRSFSEKQSLEINRLKSQELKVPSQISEKLIAALNGMVDELTCPIDSEFLENATFALPCGHKNNADALGAPKIGDKCFLCSIPVEKLLEDKLTIALAAKMKGVSLILKEQGIFLRDSI